MDVPKTSIAGHQGAGVTLILGFAVFALWFSITKRLPNLKKIITDPTYATGPGATATGAAPPGSAGTTTPKTPTITQQYNPFLPKWNSQWGPVPSDWNGPK